MSATTTMTSETTNRGTTAPASYTITPASPMGEHADAWAAKGVADAWGVFPSVSQLQSEADPAAFERANSLATLTRYANARKGW